MSAVCGILSFGAQRSPELMCQAMLAAQIRLGPHRQSVVSEQEVAFGHALYRLSPEDIYDQQPARGGPFLIAADVRLDNRDDLIAQLRLGDREPAKLSDSAIVLSAYEKWGEGSFARLVGAFAIAVWDSRRRTLILARDPAGSRPIHYHSGSGFFAFSSLPMGLHTLSEVERAPDEERLAAFVAEIGASYGEQTFYKDIRQLQSGHLLFATSGGIQTRRFWDPPRQYLRLARPEDYVEAYREQLDQAVRSQLRGADGLVATHLSSGVDSSAVTATAARLLAPAGGRVLAFTAAPREGFDGAAPRGRLGDESGIAAETAALHGNVEHIVVRPQRGSILSDYVSPAALYQQPVHNTCNSLWWRAINAVAQARGASVMLTGEVGNLTISAGGLPQLADLIREWRWLRWSAEGRKLVQGGTVRWRGVVAASLGPWMPRSMWKAINVAFLGESSRIDTDFIVGRYWRDRLASRERAAVREFRPPRDSRGSRVRNLQSRDPGVMRKEALVRWGVDTRDPTSDQRLVEFCLALPPEMLLADGLARPLARRALADRLPNSVLYNRLRGQQFADWYERIGPAEANSLLEEMLKCDAVHRIVNVDRIRELIRDWPSGGWDRPSVYKEYRHSLLRALTAAHFAHQASFEPGSDQFQPA